MQNEVRNEINIFLRMEMNTNIVTLNAHLYVLLKINNWNVIFF